MVKKFFIAFVVCVALLPNVVGAVTDADLGSQADATSEADAKRVISERSISEQVTAQMIILNAERIALGAEKPAAVSSCSCFIKLQTIVPKARADWASYLLQFVGLVTAPATFGQSILLTNELAVTSEVRVFGENYDFIENQNRDFFNDKDVKLSVDMVTEKCEITGNLEKYKPYFVVQSCNYKKKGTCCCQKEETEFNIKYYNCQLVNYIAGKDMGQCPGLLRYEDSMNGVCQPEVTKQKKDPGKGESNVTLSVDSLKDRAQSLNMLGTNNVKTMINRAITLLMAFMGSILLALYIYAGLMWMLASGNDEKITASKNILVWSTLGVAVMMASYVIVTFIFTSLAP